MDWAEPDTVLSTSSVCNSGLAEVESTLDMGYDTLKPVLASLCRCRYTLKILS